MHVCCSHPQEDGSEYAVAAWTGDLPTLERMRRLGCPLPRWRDSATGLFMYAMFRGPRSEHDGTLYQAPLPALRWLLDAGLAVDWEEAMGWAREREGDAAEVEEWLRAQREQRAGGAALKRRRLARLHRAT